MPNFTFVGFFRRRLGLPTLLKEKNYVRIDLVDTSLTRIDLVSDGLTRADLIYTGITRMDMVD